jgi:hypothetical protein
VIPRWRRRRRVGWAFDAPRCWCGWYLPHAPGNRDESIVGHAVTCPIANFNWITSEEQLAAQRLLLMIWAETMERVTADPEYLLTGASGDWREVLNTWQHGLINAAVRNGWERPLQAGEPCMHGSG